MVRGYLKYRKKLEGVGKEYDDCPQECIKNRARRYDALRTVFCNTCPRFTRREEFERETLREWEKWFTRVQMRPLVFAEQLDLLYKVVLLSGIESAGLTVTAGAYLAVYEDEERRSRK